MTIENIIFTQLMGNEEYSRKILPHLKEEYFQVPEEQMFLKIYRRFFSKYNKVPSAQTMRLEIDKLKSSADVHERMIGFLENKEPFEESFDYLVEQTEEYCKQRALYNAIKEAVLIMDGTGKEKRAPEAIPSILSEALAVTFDNHVGHNYLEDALERYDYYHSDSVRVKTGIKMFDKITRKGFPKKTFNVLLAPPHGGKTLCLVNIGVGALNEGNNVLYITMEMAAEEIGKRFDVNLLDIDFDMLEAIPKDTFTKKFDKIKSKARGKLVIKEFPTGGASAANFKSLLQELKTKQGFTPDMIIIDYMNICASEFYRAGSVHNTYTIVGAIGKELRALAIETNTVVLSATQTNRSGVESSDFGQEAMSDSSSTNMIADMILGIINTAELKQLRQVCFKQIKNRFNGIVDFERFIMGVDYGKMKLFDLVDDGSHAPPSVPDKGKGKSKLNKAPDPDHFNIDMSHSIKPETAKFDDFVFENDE